MKITQRKTWIGLGIAAASLTLTACGTAWPVTRLVMAVARMWRVWLA